MAKTHIGSNWGWYLLVIIILFVLFAPKTWWGGYYPFAGKDTGTGVQAEGTACMTNDNPPKAGTIKGGVCKAN